MKIPMNIKAEMIEIRNKDNSKSFLIKKNNEWIKITQEEYNILMRG